MNNINAKAEFKAFVDPAKELLSSGETIHQVFGELSISLERLLTDSKTETHGADGSKKIETKNWIMTDRQERLDFIRTIYLSTAKELLEKVYQNQKDIRTFIKDCLFLIIIILIIIFEIILLNDIIYQ